MCRQLGYPSIGAAAFGYSRFGQGEGPIVLDNVQCTGQEAYLTDCPNNGYFTHNCAHYEDAGVRCPGMTSVQFTMAVQWIAIALAVYIYIHVYSLPHEMKYWQHYNLADN